MWNHIIERKLFVERTFWTLVENFLMQKEQIRRWIGEYDTRQNSPTAFDMVRGRGDERGNITSQHTEQNESKARFMLTYNCTGAEHNRETTVWWCGPFRTLAENSARTLRSPMYRA